MTKTLEVEHFTAKDYDDYVLISSSLDDNKPYKFFTKGVYWACRFFPPLFGKYRYLYFSKDELKDENEDKDDIIAVAFKAACFRNGIIKLHNWLLSTDEDEDEEGGEEYFYVNH